MRTKKYCTQLISLLLSCIMVLQMIPFQVFAAEEVTSGICGGGVTWHLDGDVLYIEGEGEMYDFLSQWDTDDNPEDKITLPPWIGKSVTKIVVGEGVTYIGNKAFYEMSDVVEVELPSTLEGIGMHAFAYMEKLEEVILPEGLRTMGERAFQVCHSMETLYIPSTLKVIPNNAFWECTSLTDLTISEGVEEIGEGAFNGCTGLGYESENGDLNNLFDRPGLQYVEIPGSVKTIGGGAFASCTMLREVVLHEGIEHIGFGAFNNCNSLYDITLPASLKTMGDGVFDHLGGNLDYKLEEQGIPVTRLQNVYILSRELSLYAPVEFEEDTPMTWFYDYRPFAIFHVYEDSVAAREIEEYNAGITDEYTPKLYYSYIPNCGHELEAFVSDDENTHTRTCTEDGCTASQTVRHTLTVDLDNLTMGDCETDLSYRLYCTACDYVGEFITKEATGHDTGYYSYYDEEYHDGYCDTCYEYVQKPHDWEYEEDPTATEPYEVEAYCMGCGHTQTITVLPAEATIISVKAKDENGDDAVLPEDAFTVRWEDSEGNLLAEGTTYVHEQGWLVTEDTPVFAVVSFSDEVRGAYSTGSEYRHKVTVLGERTEFVLVPRETLTVTGRVMVDGYTYPPVDSLSLTLTTVIAGNETVVTVTPDNSGYFTAEIRRASTRLDYAALGYERVVLENVQMMPAVDGVIDVGTLTLVNKIAYRYPTVESSDYATVVEKLVGASLIAVNERTGEEYNGAKIERHGDNSLAISFGMDMDKYFMIGDRVTIRCARMDEVIFDPYTFTITKQDEQVPLDITVYKAPKLEITLNRQGHVFLFDSEDNLVFDSLGKTCSSFLPRDTYTLVAIEQNYRVPTIDAPDALEQLGVPSEYYLKETIDLTEDVTLERELPYFYYGGDVAIAASFDTAMQTDGLVPMYLNFNHLFKETYAEGETIEFTFSASDLNALPVESIGGTYAFGADELGLTERIVTDRTDSLVVTTNQPRGTIMLYVKPTGESLSIHAKISSGTRDYLKLKLPEETSVRMIDPTPSGWTTNADHFVTLYTKLPTDQAPYNGYLYVNGELKSEKKLNITGDGRNYLPYTLERYDDGASTHDLYVEIMDKDGELVWTSENYMVTLTNRTMYNTVPQELTIRIDWEAQRQGLTIVKKIDLQKNPGASFSVPVNEKKINADGTLTVDAVFNYALKMSDNDVIKDNTVYMKVFCGEDDPVPTIYDVKLRYNGETGTYDGSLTLEAGTYTVRDLPYGYSFDYSMAAGGSSNSVPVGSAYGTSYSVEQLVDEMNEKASAYIAAQQLDPYEYYDPDDVDFIIENMYDLTDEDKEMMRALFSINNDLYQLQESAKQDSTAAALEHFGEAVTADTPAEGIQGIMESVGEDIACSPFEAGEFSESELEEYTEINTSEISEEMETEANSLYLKNEPENNRVSVIDPNNELEFSVQYTQPEPGSAAEGSFEAAMKETASSFFSAAISAVDVAIEWTSKAWNYYDSQLTKKLGLQADLTELELDIDVMQGRLDRIKMKNPDIDWADCYEKGFFDAQQTSLNVLGEYRETKQTLSDMEKNLKNLRADLVSTKMNLENCQTVAGNTIFKYARTFRVLNSEAVAWGFTGLDIYSLISSIADAVEEFNSSIKRHNKIQYAEEQAKRWREDFGVACPTDQPKYEDQWEKCFDAYQELMNETAIAKDWNKQHLYVKYAQVVGELGSIAAGFVMKGPQGVFVGLGIGILGGASELLMLEKFEGALEEVNKLIPKVETACVEPLADKSIADKDCGEPDGEGGGAGGSDSGSGTGTEGNGSGEEPQYPVKTNPTIDPAGYVYEAVASNRIEGATAKIYKEGDDGVEVYWSEAEDYGEVNPQITDMDGRFAWMTPIGNWLVKVEKEGYLSADSKNDPAADADGWLPVPPPQLDVNIAMTSTAAPTVLSAGAASDQIRVVFSQYMDIAQMKELVTVTQNGQPIPVDILFEDAEVSPTDDTVYYGRILKLTRTDGAAFIGNGIVVTIDAAAKNYAGKSLAETYVSDPMLAMQLVGSLSHSYPNRFVTDIGKPEQIAVQVLDTNGKPMAGVTVTARQKIGGTLEMNESAVSDANGRAVFTVKGLSAGSDVIHFAADVVSTEMNTRVSPLGSTVPQKPEANLSDYAVVEAGTQLILTYPSTEDVVIFYTTNNTCPCSDENDRKIYDGPVTITEDTFFRIAAWTEAGGYSERLNLHITIKVDDHICKDHLTRVEAKPADCTVDGNIEHWRCSCGKYFADAFAYEEIDNIDAWKAGAGKIAAEGHKYTEQKKDPAHLKTEAAKCTEYDVYWYDCSVCDANAKNDPYATDKFWTSTDAGDHKFDEKLTDAAHLVAGSGANCQDVKEYYYDCAHCATISTTTWASTEVGGHEFDTTQWGYKEVVTGHAHKCKYCNEHDTIQSHTPNMDAPTEDVDKICTACLIVLDPATDHICKSHLTKITAESATCTKDGNIEYYECSCTKYYTDSTAAVEITDKDSVVIKAGHNYGTLIDEVPAKHTADELKAGMKAHYFCDNCSAYFTAEKVAADESNLIIPAPVHEYNTTNGYKKADGHADTCSCGTHNTVVGHTPDREAATETDPIKCLVCGYEITPALGVTTYTIIFAANGGAGSMADVTGISGEYTLPACTFHAPEGMQFKAWSVNGNEKAVGDKITVTADTNITAVWEDIPVTYYTVTFDSNGGSYVMPQTVATGQKAAKPADPVKNGYTFKGWTLNGFAYNFNTAVTGNITLVASWEENSNIMDDWYWTMIMLYSQKFDIAASADQGGVIDPFGVTKVQYSKSITYSITADIGYTIKSVIADGKDVGAVSTYTFQNVTKNHTIHAVFEQVNPYTDVNTEDWFYEDVLYVTANGLMKGTGSGKFSPEITADRAMLVTVLWRLEGCPIVDSPVDFFDVANGMWYSDAIHWASANGIVKGYGDGTFGPTDMITREQVLTILNRYADFKGWTNKTLLPMLSRYQYSVWAENHVIWGENFGLLDGLGVDLSDMTAKASRAELAAYLSRFMRNIIK